MEPGDIAVARTLPIDGALLADVLLRLRRDAPAGIVRWTLGDHGAADVDVNFASDSSSGWRTVARLWQRERLAVVNAALRLVPLADMVELRLDATTDATAVDAFEGLTRAFVDELGEELLWHASDAGVS
jgi:hypothetical protein